MKVKGILIALLSILTASCYLFLFPAIEKLPGRMPDHVEKGLELEPDENCSFLFCDFWLEGYDNTYTKDVFTGEDPIGRYGYAKLRPGLHALGALVISSDVFRTVLRLRFEKGYVYRIDYTGGREFIIQRMRLDGTGLETTTVRK